MRFVVYPKELNLDIIPSKTFIIAIRNESTCGMSIVNSTKASKVFVKDCSSAFTDTERKEFSEMNKLNPIHYLKSNTCIIPFRDIAFTKFPLIGLVTSILYPASGPSGISIIKDSSLMSFSPKANSIELFLARLRLFSAGDKSSTGK